MLCRLTTRSRLATPPSNRRRTTAPDRRTARHGAAPGRRVAVRFAWSSLAAALIGVLWASAASAHAAATETDPASGAVLDAAPSEVVVEFNEPVTPVDAGTGVVAPDGDRADTDVVQSEDGTTITIAVDSDLEGTYLVGYRVVSDDGHPVSGTFTYSVLTETEPPSAEALTAAGTDPFVQALLYGNRWFGYAALALALGAGILLVAGARPREAAAKLVATGLAVVAMTAVLGLPLQAAYENGTGIADLDPAGLQSVMQSNIGLAALLRLLLVLLALPLMRTAVTGEAEPGRPVIAGLAGVGLALGSTWPLAGHPMASDPVVVAFIADWVHLVTALAWGGGVFALLILALRKDTEIPDRTSELWIALVPWLLANLIVAGIASSLLHIDSIEALTQTQYGRLVALKAGILIVIVAIGLLTRRALLRGTEGRKRLRLMAGLETVFLAVVLGAVAVLVQAVPAKTALLEAETNESASTETATLVATEAYTAQVVLEPGRPGANSVRILADDLEGAAFEAVEWEATYGLEGEEPEELRLIELRPGILAGEVNLGEAGRWVFTFTLTDDAGNTATAEAVVDVA
jgi:copper transport protein